MIEINIKKALNQNSQLLEEKVLKAIFKRNDIIVETLDIINPNMFAMPSYASIYSAMLSLYKSNSAINDESVQIWLESNGLSVEPNIIKKLYNESYSRLKVRETCEVLRELYRRRYMLTQVRELIDKEDEQPTSSENILERINNIAIKANEQVSNNAKIASRCFEDTNSFMADITSKLKNKIEENGITTGWRTIDTALGGFYRKQLICLCASSSAGKSWIALQTCLQMCLNNPELKVLYFSLEMSKEELEQRMLSIITGIPCDVLQRPHKYFIEYDEKGILRDYYKEDPNSERVQKFLRKIKDGVDILHSLNITVDDEGGLKKDEVLARIQKFYLKNDGLDAVFVDHTYLMRNTNVDLNTSDEFGDMYYSFKNIAKKLNCVIYALHQLNMEIKNNSDRRPSIYNIRGSSQIIDNCDILMLLYNANIHHDLLRQNPELRDTIDITFGKVRGNRYPEPIPLEFSSCGFKEKEYDESRGKIVRGEVYLDSDGEILDE